MSGRAEAGPGPWVVLQHAPHEGPGLLAELITGAGHDMAIVRLDEGHALPAPGTPGAVVVMGGAMGVHDTDRYPWLAPERAWIAETVRAGVPVLGGDGARLAAVHWHGDTFAIPDGAVHLASSDRYPNQAFRHGRVAYGLQFHLELDDAMADAWRPELPPGVDLDAGRAAVEVAGRRVLGRFVELAGRA